MEAESEKERDVEILILPYFLYDLLEDEKVDKSSFSRLC